jgi:hypothetical protein
MAFTKGQMLFWLLKVAQVQQPQNGGHSHPGSKGAKKARLPF